MDRARGIEIVTSFLHTQSDILSEDVVSLCCDLFWRDQDDLARAARQAGADVSVVQGTIAFCRSLADDDRHAIEAALLAFLSRAAAIGRELGVDEHDLETTLRMGFEASKVVRAAGQDPDVLRAAGQDPGSSMAVRPNRAVRRAARRGLRRG